MSRLLPISGRDMCKILEVIGFQKVHQVGSHVRYAHPDGRKTVVPVHRLFPEICALPILYAQSMA